MIFFIWSGRGWVVFLAIIASGFLTLAATGWEETARTQLVNFFFGILVSLPIWFYGKKWNSERRILIDKATGQEITTTNQHTAFGIPMQYWAFIFPALLLLGLIF